MIDFPHRQFEIGQTGFGIPARRDREVTMFFRHTIRRKMLLGLVLVLVMLITLSLSGISGLLSYRKTVNELDASVRQLPRRTELTSAIGLLFEPLVRDEWPSELNDRRLRQFEFQNQLSEARKRIQAYRRKLENLPRDPTSEVRRSMTNVLLGRIEHGQYNHDGLDELDLLSAKLGDPETSDAVSTEILKKIGRLQTLSQKVPDSSLGLEQTLKRSREGLRSRFWWVCATSLLAVLLFLGLVRYGYVCIFTPLRILHEGASRVAQGDFDFRVELNTRDEMAELARSFNKMTIRFQETTHDLDRQVRERSKQLIRSERLAAIGVLAAGVAHEINNPLSAIAMAAESIEMRMRELPNHPDNEQEQLVLQYLGMIQQESFRCQEITSKLLDFSRGQDGQRKRTNLTEVISEVLAMIQHVAKFRDRNIEFGRARACYAEVNGPEIKQVVLNLVANGLESMQSGGILRISIEEQTDQITIAFRDNGCGMTSEVLDNIFEPFFTKRKSGKGTGLGMSISHRIISDHGGTIEALSDGPDCGSTFIVRLPRGPAEVATAA